MGAKLYIDIDQAIAYRLRVLYRYNDDQVKTLLECYGPYIAEQVSGGNYNAKEMTEYIVSDLKSTS